MDPIALTTTSHKGNVMTANFTLPKLPLATLSLLSAGALLVACSDANQDAESSPKQLVEISVNNFLKHWNAGEPKALSMLFAEDAIRVVSSQQLPAVGRAAICKQFEDAMAEGTQTSTAKLTANVATAMSISDNLIIADGTFKVSDEAGETIRNGKWGNLFRLVGDKVELVLESAHAEIGLDKDRSVFATIEREKPPEPNMGSDKDLAAAMDRSAARYSAAYNAEDAKLIAAEFLPDGMRIVSTSADPSRGREAVTASIMTELAAGSPFKGSTLSSTQLGMLKVSPTIVIANGLWEAKDAEGGLVEFGQWGNVLEIQDNGELLLVMESAGGFASLEQSDNK